MSEYAQFIQVVLIRKKRVLEKFSFSKSTLHDLMKRDESFPRPIYLNGGRIPYWREADIDRYIAASAMGTQAAPSQMPQRSTASANDVTAREAVIEVPREPVVDPVSFSPRTTKISTFEQLDANGRKRVINVEVPKKRAVHVDPSASCGWQQRPLPHPAVFMADGSCVDPLPSPAIHLPPTLVTQPLTSDVAANASPSWVVAPPMHNTAGRGGYVSAQDYSVTPLF